MPRGKFVSHKGRNRHFTSPEELEQQRKEAEQQKRLQAQRRRDNPKESESEEEEDEKPGASGGAAAAAKTKDGSGDSGSSEESDSDSDDANKKKKGVEGLIEIENPNRVVKKQKKVSKLTETDAAVKPELSRREREELEKQRARAHYLKLHAEGKTEEARADLARLALVRKQREEAAKKREEERVAKEAAKASQVAATQKALGKR